MVGKLPVLVCGFQVELLWESTNTTPGRRLRTKLYMCVGAQWSGSIDMNIGNCP